MSSFTCPACQRTSAHPHDAWYGYCGNCHDFTETRARCSVSLRGVVHGRHIWHPSLTDLDHPKVVHIRTDVDLICPGYPPPEGAS